MPLESEQNITPYFSLYREYARALWNTTSARTKTEVVSQVYSNCTVLHIKSEEPSWDQVESFEHVCVHLFDYLVLSRLGLSDQVSKSLGTNAVKKAMPNFIVRPIPEFNPVIFLQILDDDPDSIRYSGEQVTLSSEDVEGMELYFVDFFDYDSLGIRDFEFYEVRIGKWLSQPRFVGLNGLVRFSEANVFLRPYLQ